MERDHQVMADDGSQRRKPDFRTAVDDVKALATVLVLKLESILGRRLKLRSPAVLAAIGIVATLALTLVVVMVLLQAGDANAVSDNAALIAAVVALGGVFTTQMVSIALDDRRSHEARNLEAQRTREAALQNYFEAVGELLIEKPLRRASPRDNLSTVVRAQTLSVLVGLDPERKRTLLRFLYESGLIYKAKPVVRLNVADLSYANLYHADLREADLREAELSYADLRFAILYNADLSNAYLFATNLSDAFLMNAKLSNARLRHAKLNDAHLIEADLSGADLSGANLRNADLSGAHLSGANLTYAYLSGANLVGTTGVTSQELEQQAYSLEGAIMPDGSKHL